MRRGCWGDCLRTARVSVRFNRVRYSVMSAVTLLERTVNPLFAQVPWVGGGGLPPPM